MHTHTYTYIHIHSNIYIYKFSINLPPNKLLENKNNNRKKNKQEVTKLINFNPLIAQKHYFIGTHTLLYYLFIIILLF